MNFEIENMQKNHLNMINIDEFDDFWNINILKNDLKSSSSIYIIAKQKDNIVGFAGINIILDEAHIVNIAVRKDMRNLKIGSKLLENLINRASKISSLITLEVNVQNLPAIHLYEKYGFEYVRKKK